MAQITAARFATCVVAASLMSVAAATLPTEAMADDGPASVPAAPIEASPLDTGAVLVGEASAAVEGAMDDTLGDVLDDAVQSTEQTADVDAASTAVPSVTPPAAAAPEVEPAPTAAPADVDTTPVPADTAAGIATTTSEAAPTGATTVQASPTNVNVSVRIGSPGDNGPVTQVNVAATVASTAAASASGTSAAPATPAAAPSATSGAHASTPSASQPAATAPAGAQDDQETWTWQWNCLSKPDLSVIPTAGSTTGSMPKNWTWIWNCGQNPTQYQDATTSQYQPSNVNIAIRISSPGNDGPVSQANVAVAAHVGPVVVAAPAGPTVALPVPVTVADVVSDGVIPGVTSLPALVTAPEPIWVGGDVAVQSIVETFGEVVDLPFVLPPLSGPTPFHLGERKGLFPARRGIVAPAIGRLAPLGTLELGKPVDGAGSVVSSADEGPEESGPSTSRAAEKPAPRWRAPIPRQMPTQVPSGASFAPATGGSSSGGGIPVFLALPFLAAMLDLARRVTLDRVALPSGHRSRMPEDPG